VEITEDDLLLRPWRPADAEAVHRACQDPDIQRWTTVPTPYGTEHATTFVAELSPAAWATGSGAPFAVVDRLTGELLGSCGLVSIDHRLHSAEIGYWVAPWARGRAVAARSTRAIAHWAFDRLGLGRIVWQAEVGNHASRLAALRAGFRMEGSLRLADPHPRGGLDGWIGSLVPADLRPTAPAGRGARGLDQARVPRPEPVDPFGPQSLVGRRARVFMAAQPVLQGHAKGGDVALRRPAEGDVPAIVNACRDPESARWTMVPDPYRQVDAEGFVRSHAPRQWARGAGAVFVLADEADAYVGSMELRLSPSDPGLADVGFLTAPAARGRGYAPAALRALCHWGFDALDVHRIEWRAYVGNEASRRVAEKAGFTLEGTARSALGHRGERRDCLVGALLTTDPRELP
jgi:RimJ/RimL family protein N-acetyltransferase